MELSQQVCSLEYAKKLKELGVNADSLFDYYNVDGEGIYYLYFEDNAPEPCEYEGEPISAFTVTELGELLPKSIITAISEYYYNQVSDCTKTGWIIFYRNTFHSMRHNSELFEFSDKTEADARSKMLIFLIENGYIEVNK